MKDKLDKIMQRVADRRLLRSAIRLIRCIKSGAPTFVKCNEVALMQKFLPLYGSSFGDYMQQKAEKMLAEAKNDIGRCCEEGCPRPVEDSNMSSRGYMSCKICRLKSERQARILEERAHELFGAQEPVED